MKTKLTTVFMVVSLVFMQVNAHAQFFFNPDLAVTNLTVSNVNGNSVTFTYQIQNVGWFFSVDLKSYYFQTYVSTNSTYDVLDLPAGGAILGNNAPVLAPGQVYTGSWTSNTSGSLDQYHYLIYQLKLRSGYSSSETNWANNTMVLNMTPSFSDLTIDDIAVTGVDGNTVSYNYTIRNAGGSTLYLDRFYFQTYISSNSSLDNTDLPSGGALFTTGTITLAPGQTYTGSWSSNGGVSLESHPYLIFDVHLLSGKSNPQITTANDRYAKYLVPSFADLTIPSIVINSINGTSFNFNYTIANSGNSILHLDYFYFQAYVSQDTMLDASDIPAGGSIFTTSSLPLSPSASYTGSWTSNPGVSLTTYPYLIFDVKLLPGKIQPQQYTWNDRRELFIHPFIIIAPPVFDIGLSQYSLRVSSSSTQGHESTYLLYNMSGEKVKEGSFVSEEEINTATLEPGVYILKLTDGVSTETKKIAIGFE